MIPARSKKIGLFGEKGAALAEEGAVRISTAAVVGIYKSYKSGEWKAANSTDWQLFLCSKNTCCFWQKNMSYFSNQEKNNMRNVMAVMVMLFVVAAFGCHYVDDSPVDAGDASLYQADAEVTVDAGTDAACTESEVCNGVDDNCDGRVDEGLSVVACFYDNDGDGWGRSEESITSCGECPEGYVPRLGDCLDTNAAVHPGVTDWQFAPYTTEGEQSYDYNCDGAEEPWLELAPGPVSCSGTFPMCEFTTGIIDPDQDRSCGAKVDVGGCAVDSCELVVVRMHQACR